MNKQIEIAHAIAFAHSHDWAVRLTAAETEAAYLAGGVDAIADASRAREAEGIMAPTVDDDGNIYHTTGSGRLHWSISRAGAVRIVVSRPECERVIVLHAWSGRASIDSCSELAYVRPRHVAAAVVAMRAVAGPLGILDAEVAAVASDLDKRARANVLRALDAQVVRIVGDGGTVQIREEMAEGRLVAAIDIGIGVIMTDAEHAEEGLALLAPRPARSWAGRWSSVVDAALPPIVAEAPTVEIVRRMERDASPPCEDVGNN